MTPSIDVRKHGIRASPDPGIHALSWHHTQALGGISISRAVASWISIPARCQSILQQHFATSITSLGL